MKTESRKQQAWRVVDAKGSRGGRPQFTNSPSSSEAAAASGESTRSMIQLVPDPPLASSGLAGAHIAQNRTGRTSSAAHAEEVRSELELTIKSVGTPRVEKIGQTVFVAATFGRALASFVGFELGSTGGEVIAADAPG